MGNTRDTVSKYLEPFLSDYVLVGMVFLPQLHICNDYLDKKMSYSRHLQAYISGQRSDSNTYTYAARVVSFKIPMRLSIVNGYVIHTEEVGCLNLLGILSRHNQRTAIFHWEHRLFLFLVSNIYLDNLPKIDKNYICYCDCYYASEDVCSERMCIMAWSATGVFHRQYTTVLNNA